MTRTARASQGGFIYHVLNRGNAKNDVFHKDLDFLAFVNLMRDVNTRVPMRLLGYCLMTNHFHLILWPFADGDLSRWMHRLMTAHVRRYHRHYESSGHIWQGRFKAFPVQDDEHYFTLLRYVDRNPKRAGLVESSQDWRWSSLNPTARNCPEGLLSEGPLPKGSEWLQFVDSIETEAELKAIRHSIQRGTPYGDSEWQNSTAIELGIESSLRPRGRPRTKRT